MRMGYYVKRILRYYFSFHDNIILPKLRNVI